MADELERWFDVADNRGEWARLRRALALEDGFALFVVDVPDVETEGRVVELLAGEREPLMALDARSSGDEAPVRELLRTRDRLAVLRGVEASRWDLEALDRCLVQLNARRDQIAARAHALVIVLRRDASARMLDVAPDLYSVHRARFRFARLIPPQPTPLWLLTDEEFAAVLDDDGRPFERRAEPFNALAGFDAWSRARPDVSETIAARIFARNAGLRCLVRPAPNDLARALAEPSIDVADLLRAELEFARAEHLNYLAHLCSTALGWMHLRRSELAEAHVALAVAREFGQRSGRLLERRSSLMELEIGKHEGWIDPDKVGDATAFGSIYVGHPNAVAVSLSLAANEWAIRPGTAALGHFRMAVDGLEWAAVDRWRFDAYLRSVPRDLVAAAVSEPGRGEAIDWLWKRRSANDSLWDWTWTTQLMIERALEGRVDLLVRAAWDWLDALESPDAYEVWRPLVDIHVEAGDRATMNVLTQMAVGEDAPAWFNDRHPEALWIVADLVERGLVDLSPNQRDELRTRAANRYRLPMPQRLGWWAIELALTERRDPTP